MPAASGGFISATAAALGFDGATLLPVAGVGFWCTVVVIGSSSQWFGRRCGAHQARTSTGIYRCPVRLVRVPGEGVGAAWCGAGAAVVRLVRVAIFTRGAGLVQRSVVTVLFGAGRFSAKTSL